VVRFGGLKGGRRRKDGLRPGTPAADAADREKDAKRKRDERAATAAAAPAPPLPSALAPQPASLIPGALPAPAPGEPHGTILTPGLPLVEAPPILWQPKDVEDLAHELIALTEELCTNALLKRAHKAHLPAEVVKEIEKDVAWAARAKKLVELGASELVAKYLNESQVPLSVRPWIMISIGSLQIAVNQMKLIKRLDKLIEVANQSNPAPAAAPAKPLEKKP
jgi:hypothetical protein